MAGIRFGAVLDLVYPRLCVGCGAEPLPVPRRWLCVRCLARVQPVGPSPCPVCAGSLGPGAPVSACPDCRRLRPKFEATVAVGAYDGILADLVTRLKYARDASCAWPLGELLADTVEQWPPAAGVERIVPVPLRFFRRVHRGFNQAELLAAAVARRLGLPLDRFLLRGARGTAPQAGLTRSRRLQSRRGAYRITDLARLLAPGLARLPGRWGIRTGRWLRPRAVGRTVLLVDDVMTTGATASEAARVLRAAGAARVLVAVVARA